MMAGTTDVRLPSAEFQKTCLDLKEFGETMQRKAIAVTAAGSGIQHKDVSE